MAAKSDALDDQVLIEGKAAGKKDVHAAVNDQFVKNVTMLVNADRESKKQPSVPFDVLRAELLSGKTYEVSAEGFDGARDAWVNKKTSKLARLGKKIGKSAPALGRLYAPVRKLDKLAEARFEEKADTKKYRRQFWTATPRWSVPFPRALRLPAVFRADKPIAPMLLPVWRLSV